MRLVRTGRRGNHCCCGIEILFNFIYSYSQRICSILVRIIVLQAECLHFRNVGLILSHTLLAASQDIVLLSGEKALHDLLPGIEVFMQLLAVYSKTKTQIVMCLV